MLKKFRQNLLPLISVTPDRKRAAQLEKETVSSLGSGAKAE